MSATGPTTTAVLAADWNELTPELWLSFQQTVYMVVWTMLIAGLLGLVLGVALYTRVMGDLRKAAKQLAEGDLPSASAGMSFGEIKKLISAAG